MFLLIWLYKAREVSHHVFTDLAVQSQGSEPSCCFTDLGVQSQGGELSCFSLICLYKAMAVSHHVFFYRFGCTKSGR